MLKLDKNEFANYYYSKIAQYLPAFENERKSVLQTKNIIIVFAIIIVVAVCVTCYFDYLSSGNLDNIIGPVVNIIFTISVISTFIIHMIIKNYQKKLKKKLYKTLFNVLDIDYSNEENSLMYSERLIRAICNKSNIFYRYDDIKIDDTLSGSYNDLNYTIADSEITYTTGSGKHRHTVTVFDGLFIGTKTNKNFVNKIVIKTDKSQGSLSGKQKVNLEDVEFEKYFDVYSDDQIEARYIITTAFMERLKNYRIQKQCPIEVVFTKMEGREQNVFFFFHTQKDHFELPINQRLLHQELFYNILSELYDMLDIIDALKLEQNIGM